MQGYKGLKAYDLSYDLAIGIYKATAKLPKTELYGLVSQMRRASASVPANIAEGYGKKESSAEYKRYLMIAKGSVYEMGVWLDMCADLGYLPKEETEDKKASYDEVARLISGLIRILKA